MYKESSIQSMPKNFSKVLEEIRSRETPRQRAEKHVEQSGVESVEGVEQLGLKQEQVKELMNCLPGKPLGKVRYAEKVDITPDPTKEGKKVFSAINGLGHEVEVTIYSSKNFGGDEKARGFFVDEFSAELIRAYARANYYSENAESARAVEGFLADRLPDSLTSEEIENKMQQAWEQLVRAAVHASVSAELDWHTSYKLGLRLMHELPEDRAERVTCAVRDFFGQDPGKFVPSFQNKETQMRQDMRLFELNQTIAQALEQMPAMPFFKHGLNQLDVLSRFIAQVKKKSEFFLLSKQRAVLGYCADLAAHVLIANKEAMKEGGKFPEAMTHVHSDALSLNAGWKDLLLKHKEEVRATLAKSWHEAMSE